jgi:hypothetical protein
MTAHCSHLNTCDSGEGKNPFTALASAIVCSQIGQIEIRESVFTTSLKQNQNRIDRGKSGVLMDRGAN